MLSEHLLPVLKLHSSHGTLYILHGVFILATATLFLIFAISFLITSLYDKRGPPKRLVARGRTVICTSFFFLSLILPCHSAVVSLGRSPSQSSIRLSHGRMLRENADLSSSLVLCLVVFSPVFFFVVSLISLCSFILALMFAPKPHRL